MTDPAAEDTGVDQPSRLKRWDKRIEDWINGVRDEVERATPEMLDELAAAAKGFAQFLDDKANQARMKQAKKEAAPEPAGQPESESQEMAKPPPGE
jgi:hypothetical protein